MINAESCLYVFSGTTTRISGAQRRPLHAVVRWPSCVARRKIHGYAASLVRWMAPLNRERGSKPSQRHIPPAARPGGQCSRPLLYFCSPFGSITAGTAAPGGQGVQPPAPQRGAASRPPFWSFGTPIREPRSGQHRRIGARDCRAGCLTGSCQACRAPRQGFHATGTGCDQRPVRSRPVPLRCRVTALSRVRNPPTGRGSPQHERIPPFRPSKSPARRCAVAPGGLQDHLRQPA